MTLIWGYDLVGLQTCNDKSGATAGSPSSAESTVGQANRGTPQLRFEGPLANDYGLKEKP